MGTFRRFAVAVILGGIFSLSMWAQSGSNAGTLRGQVTDPSGAVVTGAAISVAVAGGEAQKAVSDKLGNYVVRGLPVGNVTVSATAAGFTTYQMPNVIISAGQAQQLDIALDIAVKAEQVTVQSESNGVDVSPESNASATVLKERTSMRFPTIPMIWAGAAGARPDLRWDRTAGRSILMVFPRNPAAKVCHSRSANQSESVFSRVRPTGIWQD